MVAVGEKIMQQCNTGFVPAQGNNATVTSLCKREGHWDNALLCKKQLECCNQGKPNYNILLIWTLYLLNVFNRFILLCIWTSPFKRFQYQPFKHTKKNYEVLKMLNRI
jgi:hypothetical protein